MNNELKLLSLVSCFALAGLVTAGAQAQSYPVKPIRLVVPFVAGGNTDIVARAFVQKMSENIGQPIYIDNRGGAGSTLGTEIVARAAPDGYTLVIVSAAHNINPAMIRKMPYDSVKDFTPMGVVVDLPTSFVVHPSLSVKNVKEFIALARTRPGELFYATAGVGTVGHLAAELLNSMAKLKLVHVPYKGAGQAIIDTVAGHVQLQFASIPVMITHVRSGKLRMIAQTGVKRSGAAPDVPTTRESGLKDFVVTSGFAMFGAAGTPRPIVDRVNAEMVKAVNDPAVKENLAQQGVDVVGSTPEEHDTFNRTEIARWIKVAREVGIQAE